MKCFNSSVQNLLKIFPIYKFQISGSSMLPVLKPGDSVLVYRLAYMIATPKVGDVVAISDPRDGKILIKRIAKIESQKYFVSGDNKDRSTDSRTFGWIAKKDIIGKVIYKQKSEARNKKSETNSNF